MTITREEVATHLTGYIQGTVQLEDLVSWAEDVMAEGEIEDSNTPAIRDIVARIGLGDVAAFGITWDDARDMLSKLGYRAIVEVEPVG